MHKLYLGPMFSGKTTKLLEEIEIIKRNGIKFLAFKSFLDTRASGIRTHNGVNYYAHNIDDLGDIFDHEETQKLLKQKADFRIFVDETQFMGVNYKDLKLLTFFQFPITFAGLNLDYKGRVWDNISRLLPFMDDIVMLQARCAICGTKAKFSHRKVENTTKIAVGGSESYEPRCYKHFYA